MGTSVRRRYKLLGTATPYGTPATITSDQLSGTVITVKVDGRPARFLLTDTALAGDWFAAEAEDQYL